MTSESFTVVFANLLLIGVLPFAFFRRDGSFNMRWWLTGFPFFASAAVLIAGRAGALHAMDDMPEARLIACLLALTSVGMICWTVGSHRVPLALWHQENDAPASIVTWGPYKYVRHPFYASFLITQTAAVLAFPHVLSGAAFLYSIVVLSVTARREEARLVKSSFGAEYRGYMTRTGRLVPGLGRLSA